MDRYSLISRLGWQYLHGISHSLLWKLAYYTLSNTDSIVFSFAFQNLAELEGLIVSQTHNSEVSQIFSHSREGMLKSPLRQILLATGECDPAFFESPVFMQLLSQVTHTRGSQVPAVAGQDLTEPTYYPSSTPPETVGHRCYL